MKESSEVDGIIQRLELQVSILTAERDALATVAEKYKENFSVLARVYATANTQLSEALRLSEELTLQYRDISRDRAESITHLLHGSRTVVGNTLGAHEGATDSSPIAKLEAVIAKREQKLNAGVRNRTFNAARALTGFADGKFPELHQVAGANTDYEAKLEYLARLDRELERLMSSRAYLLRAKLARRVGKSGQPQLGQNK